MKLKSAIFFAAMSVSCLASASGDVVGTDIRSELGYDINAVQQDQTVQLISTVVFSDDLPTVYDRIVQIGGDEVYRDTITDTGNVGEGVQRILLFTPDSNKTGTTMSFCVDIETVSTQNQRRCTYKDYN